MNRRQSARRENRPLNALLAILCNKGTQIGEVAESGIVPRRLGADGRGFADLRDDNTDLSRGHLHPRMFRYRVKRLELEAQPGHEKVGLVAGFAQKRYGVVAGQLCSEPFTNEPDLGGTDAIGGREGGGNQEQYDQQDKKKQEQDHDGTF